MYSCADSYLSLYSPATEWYQSYVIEHITPSSFYATIGSTPALILFYASWCFHCKQFMPTFQEAADALDGATVKFFKADCEMYKSYIEQFGLEGFPTVLLFVNKQHVEYKGARTVEALTTWLNKYIN